MPTAYLDMLSRRIYDTPEVVDKAVAKLTDFYRRTL